MHVGLVRGEPAGLRRGGGGQRGLRRRPARPGRRTRGSASTTGPSRRDSEAARSASAWFPRCIRALDASRCGHSSAGSIAAARLAASTASTYRSAPRWARANRHHATAAARLRGDEPGEQGRGLVVAPQVEHGGGPRQLLPEVSVKSARSVSPDSDQPALTQVCHEIIVCAALVGEQRHVPRGLEPGAERRPDLADRRLQVGLPDQPGLAAGAPSRAARVPRRSRKRARCRRLSTRRSAGTASSQVDPGHRPFPQVVAEHAFSRRRPSGGSTSSVRSKRPGRRKAESTSHGWLVAASRNTPVLSDATSSSSSSSWFTADRIGVFRS